METIIRNEDKESVCSWPSGQQSQLPLTMACPLLTPSITERNFPLWGQEWKPCWELVIPQATIPGAFYPQPLRGKPGLSRLSSVSAGWEQPQTLKKSFSALRTQHTSRGFTVCQSLLASIKGINQFPNTWWFCPKDTGDSLNLPLVFLFPFFESPN